MKYPILKVLGLVNYIFALLIFVYCFFLENRIHTIALVFCALICIFIAELINLIIDVSSDANDILLNLKKLTIDINISEPENGYKYCTKCGYKWENKVFECLKCNTRFQDGKFILD